VHSDQAFTFHATVYILLGDSEHWKFYIDSNLSVLIDPVTQAVLVSSRLYLPSFPL
jgi:hypothetical protein